MYERRTSNGGFETGYFRDVNCLVFAYAPTGGPEYSGIWFHPAGTYDMKKLVSTVNGSGFVLNCSMASNTGVITVTSSSPTASYLPKIYTCLIRFAF